MREPLPIPTLSDADRARLASYLRRAPESGCLLWTGALTKQGQPLFYVQGKLYLASRVAFVLGGGILTPERPCVLHNCPAGDNPACCEFEHLWAGTQAENAADMARKGRGRRSKKGMPLGVSPQAWGGYCAQVRIGSGRMEYLGTFRTIEEAARVVAAAKAAIHASR